MKLILALNALNTPWMAVLVIVLGCSYSIIAKHFGVTGDSPSTIIGAGIGLLTGQALHAASAAIGAPKDTDTFPTTK